jgi:uncharacterized protein YciI
MWYLIYSEDVQGSLPLRKQARPAHLARLQALQDEGRLLTAGPNPAIDAEDPADAGFTGSTVIAEFASGGCQGLGRCRSLCGGRCLCQGDHQAVQEGLLTQRDERPDWQFTPVRPFYIPISRFMPWPRTRG